MQNLTLNLLKKYLGTPIRKIGQEYEWQCPICLDTHKDNLKFNENKCLLYCFANPEHSKEILSKIMKEEYKMERKNDFKTNNIEKYKNIIFNTCKQEEFIMYMGVCNESLLNDDISLKYLFKKRGLTKNTVSFCGLGIDKEKRRWVIPTFRYDTKTECIILGFEYRGADLSKKNIMREKNCLTGLAQVNCYTPKTKRLVVVEGYFDGYALLQYLRELNKEQIYHIVTPSNGVNSLIKQISQIDFRKYKSFELFIDNDETSRPIAREIINKYPQFNDIVLDCGCKDFNEHYLKCIKHTHV